MIVRALDLNGEWTYGKGKNNYKRNTSAIAQLIQTRLKSFLGDCFFATDEGIDWWNLLGGKNQVALNLSVSATILKTEGVTGLNQLFIEIDSFRQVTISYEATTIYTAGAEGIVTTTTSYLLTEDGDILTTQDGRKLLG